MKEVKELAKELKKEYWKYWQDQKDAGNDDSSEQLQFEFILKLIAELEAKIEELSKA